MDDKIKLVIASVLKPVDDTRAFEKIGRSLAQTNKYDVNIIGFESKKTVGNINISFWPLLKVNRKHILRFLAPLKAFKIYHQVKPKLIIVNTPELLLVSYLYRILFGAELVYDIQENYQMNISFGRTYSLWQKPFLKAYIYCLEGLSKYFVTHYFLAEQIYLNQLTFIKKDKTTVIENKALLPAAKLSPKKGSIDVDAALRCIITGTLGDTYGTIEGIKFFINQLSQVYKQAKLHVIGFAADSNYRKQLIYLCNTNKAITLEMNTKPIPHEEINYAIKLADIALLPYHVNPNLKDRIPTKMYEYMAYQIPMLVSKNPLWESILKQYQAGLAINFQHAEMELIAQDFYKNQFYKHAKFNDIYWNSEEEKLLNIIDNII